MGSVLGDRLKISIFGESHGPAIGVTIDGFLPGVRMDEEYINGQMARRRPNSAQYSTKRREDDEVEILSGVFDGVTTGAPLTAIIRNKDSRSADYEMLKTYPRPSHSDYTAYLRYLGANDIRGGGHFSGRLTAPIVFAGALCRLALMKKGIAIGAHIYNILEICDTPFDGVSIDREFLSALSGSPFPVLSEEAGNRMQELFDMLQKQGDSAGGSVECAVVNLPRGLGDPMFQGIENVLSKAIFGVPAVKGLEFGAGFALSRMKGSEANDSFYMDKDNVKTRTNHNGGILGGISTGMPLIFRAAIKPTPSISVEQDTVNLVTRENAKLTVKGRHDPCIVPRAVPVIEAVTAIAVTDLMIKGYGVNW